MNMLNETGRTGLRRMIEQQDVTARESVWDVLMIAVGIGLIIAAFVLAG
jgi:hypothetical protein